MIPDEAMIPGEAVEAAAAAIQVRCDMPLDLEDLARASLEAAAPHILAHALQSAAHAMELMPPMIHARYVATLRLYADEPWRLGTLETLEEK